MKQVLDSVDSVLFDCDGVIWRGDQAVPGAPRVITLLKERGKRVFYVTNNSTKTRKMYVDKMSTLGFDTKEDEVFGTAYCSAMYLKTVCELQGKVYLVGSDAMRQELEAVGIDHLTRLGIMTSCWALLMHPDSSLPRITVPMSWKEGRKRTHRRKDR